MNMPMLIKSILKNQTIKMYGAAIATKNKSCLQQNPAQSFLNFLIFLQINVNINPGNCGIKNTRQLLYNNKCTNQ